MLKEANIITRKEAEKLYNISKEIITIVSTDIPETWYFVNKHSVPKQLIQNNWIPITVIGYTMEEFEKTFYLYSNYLGV